MFMMRTKLQISAAKTGVGLDEQWVVLFAIAVVIFAAVLWASRSRPEKTDFSVTYIGAKIVHDGNASKLYDLAEQKNIRTVLLHDSSPLIFEHPPFEALLLSPLAALPYRTAYLTWGFINGLIWLGLPYLVRPYAPVPKDPLGYRLLWLLFAPLGIALYQGQSSLVVLLLYALTFVSLKNNQDFKAGGYLGLGLFKFQFVIPLAAILVLQRKWKFVAGFLSAAALLGVLSLIAVGWQGLGSYIHLLTAIAGNPDKVSYGAAIDMATVDGFVHALLRNTLNQTGSRILTATISVLLILLAASAWHKKEGLDRESDKFDLVFAAAVVISLVTGMHMFTHDLSPLMLAMLLVLAHFPGEGRTALRLALGGTLTLFWIAPLYFALIKWHCMYLMFPLLLMLWGLGLKLSESEKLITARGHHAPA